jgi:hypothetical protein
MQNKRDIQKESGSLDKLISELSIVLDEEKTRKAQSSSENELVKEMEEALCELRQARGFVHLLIVLEMRKESAWGKKSKGRTSH